MTLIYNKALNQFIFHPPKSLSKDDTSGGRQPKANKHRNQSFYTVPKIPNTIPAQHQLFIPQVDKLALLLVVSGWTGITIYFLHYPIVFSPIGLIFYLAIEALIFLLTNVLIYKYELENQDLLHADLAARGTFFRDVIRSLQKRFSNLNFLFYDKYDCTRVKLDSNCDAIAFRNNKAQIKSFAHLIASNSEARYRWKYKDPKIQNFLEKYQDFGQVVTFKKLWFRLASMFIFEIPSEDGICLVLPYFIGINSLTAIVFSLLFGFAHFKKNSVINCLRITFSTILIILFILPNYGLLTCIIGHLLYDLFFSVPDLQKAIHGTRKLRSLSSQS